MKSDLPVKQMILVFAASAIAYFAVFAYIEHRRTRNGPWSITFSTDDKGVPSLTVNEPKLQISGMKIRFLNQSLSSTNLTLTFNPPMPVPFEVPFGKCVFLDTTFQPGTVVLELFGHEIQLMPRVLTIDKKEIPWKSDDTISISSSDAR